MSERRVEVRIQPIRSGDHVELRLSVDRIAEALVAHTSSYPGPVMVHEVWGNGDSARVTVERLPWREQGWRLTTQGWIKGLYRVWCPGDGPAKYCALYAGQGFAEQSFDTLDAAQAACMRHADTLARDS